MHSQTKDAPEAENRPNYSLILEHICAVYILKALHTLVSTYFSIWSYAEMNLGVVCACVPLELPIRKNIAPKWTWS